MRILALTAAAILVALILVVEAGDTAEAQSSTSCADGYTGTVTPASIFSGSYRGYWEGNGGNISPLTCTMRDGTTTASFSHFIVETGGGAVGAGQLRVGLDYAGYDNTDPATYPNLNEFPETIKVTAPGNGTTHTWTRPASPDVATGGIGYQVDYTSTLSIAASNTFFANASLSVVFSTSAALSISSTVASGISASGSTVTVTLSKTPLSATSVYLRYGTSASGPWTAVSSVSTSTSTAVFTLSGLSASTAYHLESSLESDYSSPDTASFTTLAALAVSSVVASAITASGATATVNLSRTPSSARSVYLRYGTSASGPWTAVSSVSTATSTAVFTLTGLSASTTYHLQASLESDYSSPKGTSFTTLAPPPPIAISSTTTRSITASGAGVIVRLSRTPDGATSVYLRYGTSASGPWTAVSPASTSTSAVAFTLSGLSGSTTYHLQASLESDYSSPSTTSFTTLAALAISSTVPSGVSASGATLTVNLSRTPDGATSVYLRYGTSASGPWSSGTSVSTSTSAAVFTLSGLSESTTYHVQSSLASNYSSPNMASFTTLTTPLAILSTVPSNITASGVTTIVNLSRTPQEATSVYLRYGTSASGPWTEARSVSTLTATATFTLSDLSGSTTYHLQSSLASDYSSPNMASFRTLPPPPLPTRTPLPGAEEIVSNIDSQAFSFLSVVAITPAIGGDPDNPFPDSVIFIAYRAISEESSFGPVSDKLLISYESNSGGLYLAEFNTAINQGWFVGVTEIYIPRWETSGRLSMRSQPGEISPSVFVQRSVEWNSLLDDPGVLDDWVNVSIAAMQPYWGNVDLRLGDDLSSDGLLYLDTATPTLRFMYPELFSSFFGPSVAVDTEFGDERMEEADFRESLDAVGESFGFSGGVLALVLLGIGVVALIAWITAKAGNPIFAFPIVAILLGAGTKIGWLHPAVAGTIGFVALFIIVGVLLIKRES